MLFTDLAAPLGSDRACHALLPLILVGFTPSPSIAQESPPEAVRLGAQLSTGTPSTGILRVQPRRNRPGPTLHPEEQGLCGAG